MRACARAPPTNGPPLQRRRSVAVPTSCLTYLRVRRHRQWLMSSRSYPQTPMSYNMASYPARFDQEWLACAGKQTVELYAQYNVRDHACRATVAVCKRMNPIYAPHHVGSKV